MYLTISVTQFRLAQILTGFGSSERNYCIKVGECLRCNAVCTRRQAQVCTTTARLSAVILYRTNINSVLYVLYMAVT